MRSFCAKAYLMTGLLLLAGCGQTGPLYLPEKEREQPKPQEQPAPAAQSRQAETP